MSQRQFYQNREFLNLNGYHSTAAIFCHYGAHRLNIKIQDCNQTINLVQDIHSKEDLDNARYKVGVLITELTKLQTAMHDIQRSIEVEYTAQAFGDLATAKSYLEQLGFVLKNDPANVNLEFQKELDSTIFEAHINTRKSERGWEFIANYQQPISSHSPMCSPSY